MGAANVLKSGTGVERVALASNKALNAARISLCGDGIHHVFLDNAIKTMGEIGAGGLAVNVIACWEASLNEWISLSEKRRPGSISPVPDGL
ncbi:hypothetical protein QF015_000641 [Paenarthrobacter sp. TE4293]|uniref:hypothetical protein n=1 Tax=Paenarthrobacter sp. TE4293 TaxID=3381695 RepID=UPI003D2038D9